MAARFEPPHPPGDLNSGAMINRPGNPDGTGQFMRPVHPGVTPVYYYGELMGSRTARQTGRPSAA